MIVVGKCYSTKETLLRSSHAPLNDMKIYNLNNEKPKPFNIFSLVIISFSLVISTSVVGMFQIILPQNAMSFTVKSNDNQLLRPIVSTTNSVLTPASTTDTSMTTSQIVQQQSIQSPSSHGSINSFKGNGKIDSVIYTIGGKWAATGNWNMTVIKGKVTSFKTSMIWRNTTSSHTHELSNFTAKSKNVQLQPDNSLSVKGNMEVGTNNIIVWHKVPTTIAIEKGKIITIALDDTKTDHHFAAQSVHGIVSSLKPCTPQQGTSTCS
jgi:hypothetical protein